MCDVVDSTALTERLGDVEAARVWQLHDSRARALLATWRGREVDKTDGLFALFDSVDDALGFAGGYHETLAGLHPPSGPRRHPPRACARAPDPVRRGGTRRQTPRRRRHGKAAGGAHLRAGAAGQTLVSENAEQAVAAQVALRPLGHWRFKGAGEPLALFEPTADGRSGRRPMSRRPGAWGHQGPLAARARAGAQPAGRTRSFVGRTAGRPGTALRRGARLVTLLGIGGTGKTRLALRFGWRWLGELSRRRLVLRPGAGRSPDGIVNAVAQGLDVPLGRTTRSRSSATRSPAAAHARDPRQLRAGRPSCRRNARRWLDRARAGTFPRDHAARCSACPARR